MKTLGTASVLALSAAISFGPNVARADENVRLSLLSEPAPDPVETGFFRDATLVGGASAVLAGTTMLVWAAANSARSVDAFCFGPADCGGTRWVTESVLTEGNGSLDPNQGSVPLAPLGYSLVGAGAIWTLGTLLFTDEDEVPWLPLVAGLVAGGASLGVSLAVQGDSAFDG